MTFRGNRPGEKNVCHPSRIPLRKGAVYFYQVTTVAAMGQDTAKEWAFNLVNFCDLDDDPFVGISALDFWNGERCPIFRFHGFKNYNTISSKARRLCVSAKNRHLSFPLFPSKLPTRILSHGIVTGHRILESNRVVLKRTVSDMRYLCNFSRSPAANLKSEKETGWFSPI